MSTPKTPGPRELYELKQQAIRYYEDNGVPQKMEEILNSMFYENPDDVYGHMANYFESFSKDPVISKIRGHQVYDSRGQPTLQADVYCTIKNNEKLVSSEVMPTLSVVPDHGSLEERDQEEESRAADVTAAIGHINGPITDDLLGFLPGNQAEADGIIYSILDKMHQESQAAVESAAGEGTGDPSPTPQPDSPASKTKLKSAGKGKGGKGAPTVVIPDEPVESFHPGSAAVSAVSAAFCQAGARVAGVPLWRHIAKLHNGEVPPESCLPLPMVTIVSSGRSAPGKSNCVKDYMIVPKPGMPTHESIKHIMNIYNSVYKGMSSKGGSAKGKKGGTDPAPLKLTSDTGSLMPTLDRPEQAIDLLQDAITQAGLTPGEDFHIALNCAAHEIFDFEKAKYEVVTGMLKEGEGMVEFWDDLLNRYPSVIALIDPMRKQDKTTWMQLCEKVTERCLIIGDFVYHRPGLLKNEELTPDFKTTGTVMRLQNMNTVSDILTVAKKMKESDNEVVIGSCIGDSTSTLAVDLAVGIGARFIMTGAPARGERVAKLNRLIELEAMMEEEGCLAICGPQRFPVISPPPPPPEEEGAEGGGGEE